MISVLAFETSTAYGSVALIDRQGRVVEKTSLRQRSHSEFIHVATSECLQELQISLSEVDALACGQGPGSFTGIRVSGNTAKAFAWSLRKPLVALDSLTLMALGIAVEPTHALLCGFNAFRNMIYTSYFEADTTGSHWVCKLGPAALKPDEFEALIDKPIIFAGDALEAYQDLLQKKSLDLLKVAAEEDSYPKASTLAQWVTEHPQCLKDSDWLSYSPLYIRSTDSLFKKQRP